MNNDEIALVLIPENEEKEIILEPEEVIVGIMPKGTLKINENGTYDVTDKKIVNVEIRHNLLKIKEETVELINFDESVGSVIFKDNIIALKTNGKSAFGINIFQYDLRLFAGKKYRLSCNDIQQGTWVSINNDNDKMLNSSTFLKDFTVDEDTINPKVVIWINKNVIYDCKWNIVLTEL